MTLAGVASLFLCILALADPEGAKMADDGDPFGPPASGLSIFATGGVSSVVIILGLLLLQKPAKAPGNFR
jgi:hypothetical protein